MTDDNTINGTVNLLRRPEIEIVLINSEGQQQSIEAHLDTGFTGDLTLPMVAIARLNLSLTGNSSFRTGRGELTRFDLYEATISWQGNQRTINVLASEVFPLVGVGLLWGNNLSVDFRHGGDVSITELEDNQ